LIIIFVIVFVSQSIYLMRMYGHKGANQYMIQSSSVA